MPDNFSEIDFYLYACKKYEKLKGYYYREKNKKEVAREARDRSDTGKVKNKTDLRVCRKNKIPVKNKELSKHCKHWFIELQHT